MTRKLPTLENQSAITLKSNKPYLIMLNYNTLFKPNKKPKQDHELIRYILIKTSAISMFACYQ